jgi:hypothetical protein
MRSLIRIATLTAVSALSVSVLVTAATTAPAAAAKHKAKSKPKAKPKHVAANFNSCSVVTQSAAASAIGTSVSSGVLGNATIEGGYACVFYGPTAPMPRTPNVAQADTVRVAVVKGANALKWYDDYKSKAPAAQAIAGYGDQAFYDGYASLNILKSDYYVRIAVVPAGAAPSLASEEQLATAILPKV